MQLSILFSSQLALVASFRANLEIKDWGFQGYLTCKQWNKEGKNLCHSWTSSIGLYFKNKKFTKVYVALQSLFGEHENVAWVDFTRGDTEVCAIIASFCTSTSTFKYIQVLCIQELLLWRAWRTQKHVHNWQNSILCFALTFYRPTAQHVICNVLLTNNGLLCSGVVGSLLHCQNGRMTQKLSESDSWK